jgi:hypothetical protein
MRITPVDPAPAISNQHPIDLRHVGGPAAREAMASVSRDGYPSTSRPSSLHITWKVPSRSIRL